MFITAGLAAVVIIPVFILLFAFAWGFREGNHATEHLHLPDWDNFGRKAEILWWVIPVVIMSILSVVLWKTSHALDPYEAVSGTGDPLEVQVIALDWKWLFIYPSEGIATANQLTVPVGRPLHFVLTADAPMNSFWVPALGGQIMVMPGMTTQLWLRADTPGTYRGFSANLSGRGFSDMAFDVRALPPGEFEAWVMTTRRADAKPFDAAEYDALAKPSSLPAPLVFSPADTRIFGRVLDSYMMPGMSAQEPARAMDMHQMHDMHML